MEPFPAMLQGFPFAVFRRWWGVGQKSNLDTKKANLAF
jgi:hypothetical protein